MECAVGARFGVDAGLFKEAELKRADTQLLVDEKEVLMVAPPESWPLHAPDVKDKERIKGWAPDVAKEEFLKRFKELS